LKSLNIDIIFPWEVGLIFVIIGLILIIIGVRQSKNNIDDLDKIILIKPTTKIFFGGIAVIFGSIQLLPLLK
tara:strand:- start:197 stop:412 length:216 start_codon:yes stop_codon:yes gene_type:complete